MRSGTKTERIIINVFGYVLVGLFSLLCILPLLYTLSGSFTTETAIYRGLKLIPAEFGVDGYRMIFAEPLPMIRAYGVTIARVALGTALSLLTTTMTSYVLARKDFKYRNVFSFYFFFTTLFNGGIVANYILHLSLGLKNTFWVMVVDRLGNVMNMIMTRSYFQGNVPDALPEAAKIDGAGDFRIFWKVYLPISKPILATVGLLVALSHWNDWYVPMMYVDDKTLYPLQYYLYEILNTSSINDSPAAMGLNLVEVPKETFKMAMTVFTIGPVVLFYPFVQKYFVKGITVGAVKG